MIFQKQISVVVLTVLLVTTLFLDLTLLYPTNLVYGKPYVNIDVVTANNMITNGSCPDFVILDVRTQSEYNEGHLENAVLIPVAELESRVNEISQHKDSEIIVYCKVGGRSAQASGVLDSNNFTKVFNVIGGIEAWESANYPIVHEFSLWNMLPLLLVVTLCVVAIVIVTIYRERIEKSKDEIQP